MGPVNSVAQLSNTPYPISGNLIALQYRQCFQNRNNSNSLLQNIIILKHDYWDKLLKIYFSFGRKIHDWLQQVFILQVNRHIEANSVFNTKNLKRKRKTSQCSPYVKLKFCVWTKNVENRNTVEPLNPDTSFIQNTFLWTKVSGLTRLHCTPNHMSYLLRRKKLLRLYNNTKIEMNIHDFKSLYTI
jgi:hypothetical protein